MAEPLERLCASGINLLPFEPTISKLALPQVVVSRLAIVASEDVHRSMVVHSRMVSPGRRMFAFTIGNFPSAAAKLIKEEVIKVQTLFLLVPSKEKEGVFVSEPPRSGSLLRLVTFRKKPRPSIGQNAVGVQIVQSFIVVSPSEEINLLVVEDALMTRAWAINFSLCENFDPFSNIHVSVVRMVIKEQLLVFSVLVVASNNSALAESSLCLVSQKKFPVFNHWGLGHNMRHVIKVG